MSADKIEELKVSTLPRQQRSSLLVSALSNSAPLGVNILVTLLLTPFLINHLGLDRFGTWSLVGSFIGYYSLLRLGVGTGIMRYVPFYVGRDDNKAASEIISSGLAMFLVVGLFILALSILVAEPIAYFYKAGPELEALIRILGLAAAIECPLRIFDAGLRAQEKWVVVNSIVIACTLMRALGFAVCIYFGYGLMEMGYIVLALTIFSLVLMIIVFFKFCPKIRLRISMVKLSRLHKLLAYGFLTVITTLAYSMCLQSHKLIVGKLVSLEAIAVYAVGAMLVNRIRHIVWAPLQVTWPRFALLDGENRHEEVINLLRRTTRYSTILASGAILLVMVAGPPFIRIWLGEGFEAVYPVLMILGMGCLVESSLFPNGSFLGGTGRQGTQAVFAAIEGFLGCGLSILLGRLLGLVGVALGFTISVTLIRGLVRTFYICYLLRFNVFRYYVGFLLRPWLILGLLVFLLHNAGILEYVNNWYSLIIFVSLIVCLYVICAYGFALNEKERRHLLCAMRKLFKRTLILTGINR